jgi:WD40-like Beta Propeller Repeat
MLRQPPQRISAIQSHAVETGSIDVKALFMLAAITCAAALSYAGELKGTTPGPLWSVDVVQDLGDVGHNPPKVAFLDNGHLIVSQVAHDPSQFSSRTNTDTSDTSSPFRLRLSVFDASSGKILSAKEWGTRHDGTSVQVTSGGLVIRTGDLLRLCSKEFREIATIGVSSEPNQGLEIRVSTSGKTVLLNNYHFNRPNKINFSHIAVLDGDTLKPRVTWAESPGIIDKYAITDKIIARERYENGRGTVVATAFGSTMWNPLFERSQGTCSPGKSGVFVTESLLVCAYQEFVISSTDGKILLTEPFAKREGRSRQIAAAQNGRYVAVMLANFADPWDTGGHITSLRSALYDVSAKKRVMTIPMSPAPQHDYDVALSPDGSQLAILSDRKVSLYSVPTP